MGFITTAGINLDELDEVWGFVCVCGNQSLFCYGVSILRSEMTPECKEYNGGLVFERISS